MFNFYNNKTKCKFLQFCSSRKGAVQAAKTLAKDCGYIKSTEQRQALSQVGLKLVDAQLKDLIVNKGIGFHHAGMDQNDRHLVESLFLNGYLFVLCKHINRKFKY